LRIPPAKRPRNPANEELAAASATPSIASPKILTVGDAYACPALAALLPPADSDGAIAAAKLDTIGDANGLATGDAIGEPTGDAKCEERGEKARQEAAHSIPNSAYPSTGHGSTKRRMEAMAAFLFPFFVLLFPLSIHACAAVLEISLALRSGGVCGRVVRKRSKGVIQVTRIPQLSPPTTYSLSCKSPEDEEGTERSEVPRAPKVP
jgi:hypothetical protein